MNAFSNPYRSSGVPLLRPALLVLLCLVSGCLPSCQRRESRALFPADSLSRVIAERMPVDTLALAWQTGGAGDEWPFIYPHTVRFGPDGRIYVSDVEQNRIFVFADDGRPAGTLASDSFHYPYLAGFQGDTLAVQSTGRRRLDFLSEGRIVRSLPLPAGPITTAVVRDTLIYFKAVGDQFSGYITRLDARGQPVPPRVDLPGPYWRHIGFLRLWGDALFSLSGYRPVVDVLDEGRLDTLALIGFDSPMLSRSRLYMLGDADAPPLLSSAAAVADERLFALNLRPGWVRIDVFDRQGRLRHVLEQNAPALDRQFYPLDLAVRPAAGGGYDLAVVTLKPVPRLYLYHWAG